MNKKSKNIILSKTFTREHSIFYCYVWQNSNLKFVEEWLGMSFKNMLFWQEKQTHRVAVWYDQRELESFNQIVAQKINADKNYFEKIVKGFNKRWGALLPYCRGERKIKDLKELAYYYDNLVAWWSPMSIIFVVVDLKEITQVVRDRALKLRAETEKYTDIKDSLFLDFFFDKFPEYKDIAHVMSPAEIFSLGDKNHLEASAVDAIRQRLDGCALVNNKLLSLPELPDELAKLGLVLEIVKAPGGIKILKGEPASKGKAKGRVRIILHGGELDRIKKGEIIVTAMTSPEFVPALKKAAGIITDEGGMTSHAAIISRELGIPCIVGTKIATKVLKDGDYVEVDANKGIIRILKK